MHFPIPEQDGVSELRAKRIGNGEIPDGSSKGKATSETKRRVGHEIGRFVFIPALVVKGKKKRIPVQQKAVFQGTDAS